jgi:O-Methyltransferase involved in polyketide biosynthesis
VIALQQSKKKVDLSGTPQTSLLILYRRAKVSKEYGPLFNDVKALDLVESLDYDFSTEKAITDYLLFASAARAVQFDNKVKAYITSILTHRWLILGLGLRRNFTTLIGTIRWYDLDSPGVIEIRKQLIPETDRAKCIAKSFLDPSWCIDINT